MKFSIRLVALDSGGGTITGLLLTFPGYYFRDSYHTIQVLALLLFCSWVIETPVSHDNLITRLSTIICKYINANFNPKPYDLSPIYLAGWVKVFHLLLPFQNVSTQVHTNLPIWSKFRHYKLCNVYGVLSIIVFFHN